MRKRQDPTVTSLVEAVLRGTVDFRNVHQLVKETGATTNQVSAALFSLRNYRVVDVVVERDGSGWWFALPPEMDTRTFVRPMRTPETKPRRTRKAVKK